MESCSCNYLTLNCLVNYKLATDNRTVKPPFKFSKWCSILLNSYIVMCVILWCPKSFNFLFSSSYMLVHHCVLDLILFSKVNLSFFRIYLSSCSKITSYSPINAFLFDDQLFYYARVILAFFERDFTCMWYIL